MSFANDPRRGNYHERNLFVPPPDPIRLGAAGERPVNYNSATGRVLFHQSHMPLGQHAGKIMERVPALYLLDRFKTYGKQNQKVRELWFPVWSYVERHLPEIEARAKTEKPATQREYNLIIHTRLVAPDKATMKNPHCRCEVCRDDPKPCTCDPQARLARVHNRLNK